MKSLYWLIAGGIFLLDQWTKQLATIHARLFDTFVLVPGVLHLTYVENTGIAFGLLQELDAGWKSLALNVIALVAAGVVALHWHRTPSRAAGLQVALMLLLGGIAGNFFDRLRQGYVVDFIDLHWNRYHWPTFNVADSAITVGVCLLLVFGWKHEPSHEQ